MNFDHLYHIVEVTKTGVCVSFTTKAPTDPELYSLTQMSEVQVHEYGFQDMEGPFFLPSPIELDPSAHLRTAILNKATQRWNCFLFAHFQEEEVGEMLPFDLIKHDQRWDAAQEEEEEEEKEEEEEEEENELKKKKEDEKREKRENNRKPKDKKRKKKVNPKYKE